MADPMHRLPEHSGPLTDDEKAFLRLVKRSPATFGNWRCVSKALEPLAWKYLNQRPELLDAQFIKEEMHLRLTDTALIVMEYLDG
jgi:hypothetical protein